MRLVVQRVKEASVTIDNNVVGKINKGFLIYVGITDTDTELEVEKLAKKISTLRVFEDSEGKMNLDIKKVEGEILVISQFTLYADMKRGNRPSFIKAARPEHAIPLYELFISLLRENHHVEAGVFGADMKIHSINDGPVTIIYDTEDL
ncbi:MAG TPA: D-tyrosyl-tRNA(Tyr) deacylase [Acholeplasmataceae bacterium]|jgi:D-tyrosyl-tRNA(Tyr) deacylase|nr:D-tyrosyl-tRNA(Tyr) deacylase [Acholeplasmataceae bacterium]